MSISITIFSFFFFFNATSPTEIYTLSLHDALPICPANSRHPLGRAHTHDGRGDDVGGGNRNTQTAGYHRSEEHTSELQSLTNLVCRLLLEKKKKKKKKTQYNKNENK